MVLMATQCQCVPVYHMEIQRFNNNPRNYNDFPIRKNNNSYSQRVERGNVMETYRFQPRAIRGGYNPRYYSGGVEKNIYINYNQNNGFKTNAMSHRV